MFITYASVALGGAIGAVLRMLVSTMLPATIFVYLPLQILVINILGCFMMGVSVEIISLFCSANSVVRTFLMTGFLSSFTTFSAFALDFSVLVNKGLFGWAMLYVILTVALSLISFSVGAKIIQFFY